MNKEHKKLERLMLFSEVAKHLSFSTASDILSISRGHLSAQIRQLEKDMGMPLLVRSTRSVRLTAEGERVMAGMDVIRRSLSELERTAEREGKAIEGTLKITSPVLFTDRYLLQIVSQFRQLHPGVNFQIDCSYTVHDLNRSDFDLAFRATNTPPQNMVARPLIKYRHRCCASPDYFKQYGKPMQPEDLSLHQCLRGKDLPTWSFLNAEVATDGWIQINDNQILKSLALMGKGIIRVPDYLVDQEIADGRLECVLETHAPLGRTIFLIYPQLIHQSKRLSAFIDFTRQFFNA